MKVMLAVGQFEQSLSASTKIAVVLAHELASRGAQVTVAGYASEDKKCCGITQDGMVTFDRFYLEKLRRETKLLQAMLENAHGAVSTLCAKLRFTVCHPVAAAKVLYWGNRMKTAFLPKYEQTMRQKALDFDAVIVVYEPFELCRWAYTKPLNCPLYVLQLDPYGLHELRENETREQRMEQETLLFKVAKHVFTTPVLLGQYRQTPQYAPCLQKLSAVEFPCMVPYQKSDAPSPISYDHAYTNILFSGFVDDQYRDPTAVLQAFYKIAQSAKTPVRLYFMGPCTSPTLLKAICEQPQLVFRVDKCPVEQAKAAMQQADVLLNIGNALTNQVPSKLFDYFSMGKPIISTVKIKNCPSLPYLHNYPNALVVEEDVSAEQNAAKIERFLQNLPACLPYKTVETAFLQATPQYVAAQILKELQA